MNLRILITAVVTKTDMSKDWYKWRPNSENLLIIHGSKHIIFSQRTKRKINCNMDDVRATFRGCHTVKH